MQPSNSAIKIRLNFRGAGSLEVDFANLLTRLIVMMMLILLSQKLSREKKKDQQSQKAFLTEKYLHWIAALRLVSTSLFGFRQPSASEIFFGNARQIWLEVEYRRSVQHINTMNHQARALAANQSNHGETNRVRASRRPSRKHPVSSIVYWRLAEQRESFRFVKKPDDEQM